MFTISFSGQMGAGMGEQEERASARKKVFGKLFPESFRSFWAKKGSGRWFRRDNFIVLILSGILLLIIALPTKAPGGSVSGGSPEQDPPPSSGREALPEEGNNSFRNEDYDAYLEQRLKETLGNMAGIGKVDVMITLQSSEELVVEKDSPRSVSHTEETDAEGGSRNVYQEDRQEETVYRTTGGESAPYVVKTLMPKVSGVVVVAQGAGTAGVNRSITEAVQALFGIGANKVKVLKMETAR
ncbi:MAG: stage III sporulation protein AG [Clostridium sp.]|jgi:stage III sporulation protein AG|nr:stage III sporulation protein AG [Clostridium sp.]